MQITNTTYEEMMNGFCERTNAFGTYFRECENFLDIFAFDFIKYAGIPDIPMKNSNGENVPYVKLYKIEDGLQEDGTSFRFIEAKLPKDSITYIVKDYSFYFGFGILLAPALNSFPRNILQIRVDCSRVGKNIEVTIGNETKIFEFDGRLLSDKLKLHGWTSDIIHSWLNQRPENIQSSSVKFGFAMQQT